MSSLSMPLASSSSRKQRFPAISLLLLWPAFAVGAGLIIPLFLLLRTSFANRDPAVYQGSGLGFNSYSQLVQPVVVNSVVFSVGLALIVACISISIAFTAAYFVTQQSKRAQTAWLIGILSTLSLSEVLVAFAWQVMMSRRAGITNLGVWLGFLQEPMSLAPSLWAVIGCVTYFVFPFSFIALYPGLSRLDQSLIEAARTMGSHPIGAFFKVVVPNMRRALVTSFALTMVMTLGAFVAPIVLGGPSNWTIGVVISEVALSGQNLPLAAAISVLLMFVSLALVLGLGRLARGQRS
jgi:putative spermidine/putrescine transport system permease protein